MYSGCPNTMHKYVELRQFFFCEDYRSDLGFEQTPGFWFSSYGMLAFREGDIRWMVRKGLFI